MTTTDLTIKESKMKRKMKRCKNYCGLACVDGSCPIANAEEYAERCMDVIKKCDDCPYYKGCEDCIFADSEYCEKEGDKRYAENRHNNKRL